MQNIEHLLPRESTDETPVPVKDLPAAIGHCVSINGIRYDLFERENNGLYDSGALLFRGRRILIYPSRYLKWMKWRSQEQQRKNKHARKLKSA